MRSPREILKRYWGYDDFRPLQAEIIESVLQNKDTIALLPTGGGKSICYQIPAMATEGICIVVSPLIALMNDQVNTLQKMGIKAMALAGSISYNDLDRLLDNCIYGNYKFLYLSPERLQQELVQHRLEKMKINLIAVDEAHCISQWGNDFRPAYKNLNILRKIVPDAPLIAVTATATPEVLSDTINELKLKDPGVFQKSFFRENIAYLVTKEEDKLYRIEKLLKNNETTIIYTRNRKSTEEISRSLNLKKIDSTYFHGGITADEKKIRLNNWLEEKTRVIVATSAFGMGIDKSNVRKVIHFDLPESIESYFQETGRAGRDGLYAQAILLYNNSDEPQLKRQFLSTLPTVDFLKHIYRKLCNHFYIAYGEGEFTTHRFNFEKFCKQYELHTLKTYNAIQALDRLGIVKLSFEFGRKTQIHFLLPSKQVITYLERNMKFSIIGKTILRIYSGIFEKEIATDLELIASKSGQRVTEIIETLKQFEKDGVISLSLATTDATMTFIEPREDDRTINRIAKILTAQNTNKINQAEAVINYINNDSLCKSIQLLTYFGDHTKTTCGICSVCAKQNNQTSIKDKKIIANAILLLLEEQNALNSREICESLTFAEMKIISMLQQLMDAGKISINRKNQYQLK